MAPRVRPADDRREVLHLEGARARRLGEDQFGVWLYQRGDAGPDQRIVVFHLDAPRRLSMELRNFARREIDRIPESQRAGRRPTDRQTAAAPRLPPRTIAGARRALQSLIAVASASPGRGAARAISVFLVAWSAIERASGIQHRRGMYYRLDLQSPKIGVWIVAKMGGGGC